VNSPKKKNPLSLIAVLLIVGAALYLLTQYARREANSTRGPGHPAVGRPLTHLDLAPLTGTESPFSAANLQQHVTLINYWGTWCGPCLREFPHVVSVYGRFRDHPAFQLVSISVPGGAEGIEALRADTQAHLKRFQADFATYYEPPSPTDDLVELLEGDAMGIPMTFVTDQEGIIRGFWSGYTPGDEVAVEKLIRHLLTPSGGL
jgi:thiol-disulfide isomerase/thioredoxin